MVYGKHTHFGDVCILRLICDSPISTKLCTTWPILSKGQNPQKGDLKKKKDIQILMCSTDLEHRKKTEVVH